MNPRTYAIRFLLIMTCILSFAAAQGPIYAGPLDDCLDNLETAATCFDANTGAVDQVSITRFRSGNHLQCRIRSGGATLVLLSDFMGNKKEPQDLNLRCQIQTSGVTTGGCNGSSTVNNLSRREQARWSAAVRAECRDAL